MDHVVIIITPLAHGNDTVHQLLTITHLHSYTHTLINEAHRLSLKSVTFAAADEPTQQHICFSKNTILVWGKDFYLYNGGAFITVS